MQVQIADAVVSNMQAFATTGPTAFTDRISTYAGVLADESKASDDDKLKAWVSLSGMMSGGAVYRAGNVADLQKALDASQGTAFAKKILELGDRLNAAEMNNSAAARSGREEINGAQNQLDSLNQFSVADQKIMMVTMSGRPTTANYASLDEWKADLKEQSRAYAAARATPVPAVTVSLSEAAKAAIAPDGTASLSPAARALEALTTTQATASKASVALSMLRDAAKARAAAATQAQDGGPGRYAADAAGPTARRQSIATAPGEKLDTTA